MEKFAICAYSEQKLNQKAEVLAAPLVLLQTRHRAFFRAELLLFKSPVSPYRSVLWCHHVLAEKGNMGREQKEREREVHTHTLTQPWFVGEAMAQLKQFVLCHLRHMARRNAALLIALPVTPTLFQSHRTHTLAHTKTNTHANACAFEPGSRVRKVAGELDRFWFSLSCAPVRFQSPFSRPAKCLINMFNQISKQPKIDAFH